MLKLGQYRIGARPDMEYASLIQRKKADVLPADVPSRRSSADIVLNMVCLVCYVDKHQITPKQDSHAL